MRKYVRDHVTLQMHIVRLGLLTLIGEWIVVVAMDKVHHKLAGI